MAHFLALTSKGLEEALFQELDQLGFKQLKKQALGVGFEGNWREAYRAHLLLRCATRVVLPILDFQAYQPDDIYNHVKKHDFTKYIEPDQTLAVAATVRLSRVFPDQRFVAMKVKDAVVDQFREKFGRRPNVNKDDPDLRILVRVVKSSVSIAIDLTGDALSYRGYREQSVMAPLREHLAAGLLRLASWQPGQSLVDPMCGSGTFLIEAALATKNIYPGFMRKNYLFQKMKNYRGEDFKDLLSEMRPVDSKIRGPLFFGFDRDLGAIKAAETNAKKAGVADLIVFRQLDIKNVRRPVDSGMVVINPPYGERLGQVDWLKETFMNLSSTLKKEFGNWDCWLLSGNEELTPVLRMKAEKKFTIFNGKLECRWLHYKILPPKIKKDELASSGGQFESGE